MSLALLLPAGLTALAALLLPLLIHLARRSEQRPTAFAALRWLRQKPRPRHRVRFDEWLLLVLRLLLLIALALLLARPVLFGGESQAPWVAVVPGVDPAQARALPTPDHARWHWLAPGFPELPATSPAMPAPASGATVTSLLRELDASLPAEVALTVIAPTRLEGVDAQRPTLSRRVDWRVLPGAMPTTPIPANTAPAPLPSLRYAPQRAPALRYLRAAVAAWQAPATQTREPDVATVERALAEGATQLVWLAPGPVPPAVREWIHDGGTALLDVDASLAQAPTMVALWRDADGTPLVEGAGVGKGRVMRLTRPLTPKALPALLDANFPQHLRALFSAPLPAPARVLAAAHSPVTGARAFAPSPRDLQPWLVVLIALLFMAERWLASGSRHRVAP